MRVCVREMTAYHLAYGWEGKLHRHKYTLGPALPQENHMIKVPSKGEAQGLSLKFLTSYPLR